MNKTNKSPLLLIAIFICSLVLILTSISVFSVFADAEGKYVAEVNSTKYTNYTDAWNAVSDGGTVTMLKDWTIDSVLTVNENKSVTVNMNGFMINRGLTGGKSNGEVFLVKAGAILSIVGESNSNVEHTGTIQADMWHYNANGKHVIKGALITGGYSSNGGGAIHIQNNAQVNINNVTIAGNASSDGAGGGAIRLHGENAVMTIYDSEICYNKTTSGGGAAIGVEGKNANAQVLGTKINNNVVSYGKGSGGAIQVRNGTVSIARSSNRVSEIAFNTAGKNGGAIYISKGNLRLHESTLITRNVAGKEGGAIYADSGAYFVDVKGIFTGNTANENGGAIYVNKSINGEEGVKISDAEFFGNHAVLNGGAIFVDSDNNIALSGKIITNGNTPNSLYIQKSDTIASNNLTEGSKVGLSTSWLATISSPVATSNYRYFFSDKMEFNISGLGNYLFYTAATMGAPESITVGDYTYPVKKGIFTYDPFSGGEVNAYFYYSDGYFAESARYYNEHLATMTSCIAVAAANASVEGDYVEYNAAKNIIALFVEAGFSKIAIRYPEPEYFGPDAEHLSTIGYIIASKEITVNDMTVTLVAVAVRGGGYGAEWASNVTLGDGVGEAKGFNDAANQVEAGINQYLDEYEIDTNMAKFWITGFSRAGATSNLVAKRLTDTYGQDRVYAYCFEAPKGGVYSLLKSGMTYANIHNVINATDIVPFVGTAEMGFIRYGVDHILPSYKVGTDEYEQQKNKMLTQLMAIAPDAAFNDYFHEATVSYVLSTVFGTSLIKEETFPDFGTAAEWHPYLIKRIQQYSLTNNVNDSSYNKDSVNWHGYRNYWSTYKWYLYEDSKGDLYIKCYENAPSDINSGKYTVLTIEESIATVMNFYFGMDGAKKDAIVKAIDLGTIKDKIEVSDIYWDIIGEWNEFSIEEKNEQFNGLWNAIEIEKSLTGVLTEDEMDTLKRCLYVLLDFGLDFVGDDYDSESQDLLGTLVYNISNIMQTHYYETLCAWTRSYDSFYASGELVAPPVAPRASIEGGYYNETMYVQLYNDNDKATIYYTLDGTTPSATNGKVYDPTDPLLICAHDNSPQFLTLKAVSIYQGITSEVVTFNYYMNTNAIIDVYDDALHIYNFDGSAYLVLTEYEVVEDKEFLRDVQYFEIDDNTYIFLEDISLNFENKIVAHIVRDLESLDPLCASVCITDPVDNGYNIGVHSDIAAVILTFNMAQQSDNPEIIDVTFTTKQRYDDVLTVALYYKDPQSGANSMVYFNQFRKRDDSTYTFKVERAQIKKIIGTDSVNNASFVLAVAVNGGIGADREETVYKETVYTITYHLDGGVNNSINPDVFSSLTEVIFLSSPTREHYEFVGWYDKGGSPMGDFLLPQEIAQDIELYAKWTPLTYSIVYGDGVDGEEVFPDVHYDRVFGLQTPVFGGSPKREGYTFAGWDKEISPTVVGDVRYDAVWVKNHVHEPVLVEGIDATCFAPGYNSYYECADCGYFEDIECKIQILDVDAWKQTDGIITVDHIFTEQIQSRAYWVVGSGSNCQDPIRYYYGCANCDAVGTEVWLTEDYGEHDIDTSFTFSEDGHYHVCSNEGCDYTTDKIKCVGGTATCQAKAECAVCENEYGELGLHMPEEDDGDCTTAIVCSVCGEETTPAKSEHKDDDLDGKCDACEYDMPVTPETETDTDIDTDTNIETDTNIDTDTETEPETGIDTDIPEGSDTESSGNSDGNYGNEILIVISAITFVAVLAATGVVLVGRKKKS